MDSADYELIRELEKGIPLVSHPYAEIGTRIGMAEYEVIQRITALKESGIIRRMKARINQRKVGIIANALVAWNIPEEKADEAGLIFADIQGVTHCYRRTPIQRRWEYTISTVHHGWSHDQVDKDIRMMAKKTGYSDYKILYSTHEYKRTPHTRADDLEMNI